ncbi:hypothetical protein [uncultured Helicobacter sp.]
MRKRRKSASVITAKVTPSHFSLQPTFLISNPRMPRGKPSTRFTSRFRI